MHPALLASALPARGGGGYLLHCSGCFLFGGGDGSIGVGCLGRRGRLPTGQPGFRQERAELERGHLGMGAHMAKR